MTDAYRAEFLRLSRLIQADDRLRLAAEICLTEPENVPPGDVWFTAGFGQACRRIMKRLKGAVE